MKHSVRRIAIFMCLCIASATAAVAGVGWEGDVQESVPTAFGVVAPSAGDTAAYSYALVNASSGAQIGETLPLYNFRVVAPTTLHGADGLAKVSGVEAHRWGHWIISQGGVSTVHWRESPGYAEYHTDKQAVASSFSVLDQAPFSDQDPTGTGLLIESSDWGLAFDSLSYVLHPTPKGALAPCGAVHALQGNEVLLDRPIQLMDGCLILSTPVDPTRPTSLPKEDYDRLSPNASIDQTWFAQTFQAIGRQALPEGEAVVFEAAAGGFAWYVREIPFPVQMAIPAGPDRSHVIRLQETGRGETEASWRVPTLPQVNVEPMKPWGPDDSGIEHPFPASAAWTAAMDDDDVRAWMDAHPGARIFKLLGGNNGWGEGSTTPEVFIQWTFAMAEGDATFGWEVEWTRPRVAVGLPHVGPLAPSIRVDVTEVKDPPAGAWGGTAPDAASTVAALRAAELGPSDALPTWGLSIVCMEVDNGTCIQHAPAVAATDIGEKADITPDPEGPSVRRSTSQQMHWITLDAHGSPMRMGRAAVASGSTWAPAEDAVPPSSQPDVASIAGWQGPKDKVLVALGAAGLVVAALYYVSPSLLGLFSRIQDQRVLDHPRRRLIHEFVTAQPGMHHKDLVRAVGKGGGGVTHHVRKLVAAGAIQAVRSHGYACYFPRGTDRRVMAAGPALRSKTAQRLLATIQETPGASGGQLATALGINRATVSHHIRRLRDAGVLEARRDGRAVRVWPTHLAAELPYGPFRQNDTDGCRPQRDLPTGRT